MAKKQRNYEMKYKINVLKLTKELEGQKLLLN